MCLSSTQLVNGRVVVTAVGNIQDGSTHAVPDAKPKFTFVTFGAKRILLVVKDQFQIAAGVGHRALAEHFVSSANMQEQYITARNPGLDPDLDTIQVPDP